MTTKFTDAQAVQYEAIHAALEANTGNISKALSQLREHEDKLIRRQPWSYDYLESVMETETYRAWRSTMRKIMLNHAEHSAEVLAANPSGLTDQARASVAINMLKGDIGKAQQKALRGRKRHLQESQYDPSADPGQYSETAALLMEDEDA